MKRWYNYIMCVYVTIMYTIWRSYLSDCYWTRTYNIEPKLVLSLFLCWNIRTYAYALNTITISAHDIFGLGCERTKNLYVLRKNTIYYTFMDTVPKLFMMHHFVCISITFPAQFRLHLNVNEFQLNI